METYVLRVWVPDRPGALGSVASRIGAVRGDVVGIDILERGDGLAVDEIVVELPSDAVVSLLVREVSEVDGVHVEDVRRAGAAGHDPRSAAIEVAAVLLGAETATELLVALCEHGRSLLGVEWVAVLDETGGVLAADGDGPSAGWLRAFIAGAAAAARTGRPTTACPTGGTASEVAGDVAWAPLGASGASVVCGRTRVLLRGRERRQLAGLARIAATRLAAMPGEVPADDAVPAEDAVPAGC